jgi:hypothetical protein
MPTSSIARPYKIYPNLDFWFENKPSGNPGQHNTRSRKGLTDEGVDVINHNFLRFSPKKSAKNWRFP